MNFLNKKYIQLFLFIFILMMGQEVHAQKMKISKASQTLKDLFADISSQTGYDFVFTTKQLNTTKLVNMKVGEYTLQQVLTQAFTGQPVEYIIQEQTVIIRGKANHAEQPVHVGGVVVDDASRKPISGVIVSVKGTQSVASTSNNGRFELLVPEGATILEFKIIGYKTIQIPMTSDRVYNVSMTQEELAIEETVVTGIVTRKERNYTGAARTITGDELKRVSANDIFVGLSALDPAFRLVPNNLAGGNINQLPQIQMRGENSFPNLSGQLSNNPNQPLFILDGFEVTLQRIVDLDMNMINAITLLKDASATAIYGSRGANGVMVVTTKLPLPGKLQITVNNDFRLTTPDLSVYNLLDAREKLDFETRVGLYTANDQEVLERRKAQYDHRYKNMLRGINTDWLKIPVQNGYSNRTSVYVQGGDESVRYGVQLMADLQSGVMKGQNRNNYSGQFDLQYVVNKFQFRNSLRVFHNVSNESPYGSFSQYVRMNPYHSPYDAEGRIQRLLEPLELTPASTLTFNPVYNATLNSINRNKYLGLSNNFNLKYNILSNFYVESNFSLNMQRGGTDEFYSALDTRFANISDPNRRGTYSAQNDELFSYESLTTANYNLSKGKSQFFSTLGFNFSSNRNEFYSILAEGFGSDKFDNLLFAAQYEQNGRPAGDESTVRRVGVVYSGSYVYDDRFLSDVSIRHDGSSQYGADKRFGTFWSAGLGWNLHNESFFQKDGFFERLKLRASYGSTGSLNIPAYSAQSRYNVGPDLSYFGEVGAVLGTLSNPLLSWQKVYKLNIGLDADFFNSRTNLRLDIYKENTDGAVSAISIAPSTGFTSFSENLGKLQNKGFEFGIRHNIISKPEKGILWSVYVNGFTNQNILKELSNRLRTANTNLDAANEDQTTPNVLLQEGQSINTIFAVQSLGVDPTTGTEVYLTKGGKKTFTWNVADKVPVGIAQPKWNGNFGSNLSYKGFEANVLLNYQFGGQLYNQTLADRVEGVDAAYNVDQRAYDLGWKGPGDVSKYMAIGPSQQETLLTSRFVQNENILRLTSASFGYNFFQTPWLKRYGLRSLSLTAITNDLFQVSSIQIERGIDNPFARTYSLSLRAGF